MPLGATDKWKVEMKIKNIAIYILKTVAPKLWHRYCLYSFTSKNGFILRLFPNSMWIIKKGNYGDLILKLPQNAYLPWHVLYFNQIFDSFESRNRIIDLSVPSFLTIKKSQTRFFFFQAPEDDHVAKGYLALNKPNKNDIVFDIGAFCGIMSYVYSSLCKKVCAFEPNPYTYAALCTNIVHHKLDNVTPYMVGIWSKTGEVDFSINLGGGDMIFGAKVEEAILEDAITMTAKGFIS